MNTFIQALSFAFLLFGSAYFGFAEKPTEMALIILAAVLSLAFSNLDKFKKFKGAGFEAEMREKLEVMVAKQAEPASEGIGRILVGKAFGLDAETRKILSSLGNSKYTWRSISGIAAETGLSVHTIRQSLTWLAENGLAVPTGIGKSTNWGLSENGRDVFNSLTPLPSGQD